MMKNDRANRESPLDIKIENTLESSVLSPSNLKLLASIKQNTFKQFFHDRGIA